MKIGLVFNTNRDKSQIVAQNLAAHLQNIGVDVITSWIEGQQVPDLFIILGGDGTVMRSARRFGHLGIPFLTINMGRVGFMSELELDELDTYLERLINKDFNLEDRGMLQVTVRRKNQILYQCSALNEVAVIKQVVSKMTNLKLYINDEFFSEYRADGIVVATPTGSTAYSLSAGGPVILPDTEAMAITPVCPYVLALKPLVVGDHKLIKIMPGSKGNACVSVDGQEVIPLSEGDAVEITRSEHKIKFVRFKEKMFFDFLGKKLYQGGN
ncbi:MAG: NAD(+)/NADH kinase [Ignavibacteriales bacterium]